MHKNELELEKYKIRAKLIGQLMTTVGVLGTAAFLFGAIYMIVNGAVLVLNSGSSPESIAGIEKFIQSFKLELLSGGLLAALAGQAWWTQRKGTKRGYRVQSKLRKQLEKRDPHHETSDLDANGDTPKQLEEDK